MMRQTVIFTQRKTFATVLVVVLGLSLVGVAVGVSGATIEAALVGGVSGALAWGPSLFRVLLALHGALLVVAGAVRARRAGAPAELPSLPRIPWVPLVALSVLALGLRLWRLGSGLWFDEVLTLVDFVRPPLGQIVSSFPSQNQHMLFSVLAHASLAAFGESVWALRLPSVAFGIASLWALFLLGRLLLDEREALLACALMTVSYHHVWFSQNARGYMGLLFFSILATWLWLESRSRRTWPWHLAYAVSLALGMWTHLTMLFVPVTHVLLFAVDAARRIWRRQAGGSPPDVLGDLWRPVAAWALGASLTLQLYALALPEFLRTGLHEVSLESEWTNPLWVIRESLQSLQVGFGALAVVLCGLFVGAVGWLSLARRNWLGAGAMVLPPIIGGGTMLALGHNLWPRFFFFSMGFAILIAVHGAVTVPGLLLGRVRILRDRERLSSAMGTAAVMCLIVASALSLPRAYALPKQDFTGARAFVESVRGPEDAVVAVGLAGVAYHRYFAPDWAAPDTAEELNAIRAAHRRVWLVYTLPVELKAYHPAIWNAVDGAFDTIKVFPGTLGGGEVYVCRSKPDGHGG